MLAGHGVVAGPLAIARAPAGLLTGDPWYRAGGSPAPVAAWQPIGAADLAASYANVASPGTYNAAPGTAPTFGAATGWTYNGSSQLLTVPGLDAAIKPVTLIARVKIDSVANYRIIFGAAAGSCHELYIDKDSHKPATAKSDVAGIGTANTALTLGVSYVVAVTYSALGVWTFYLNGTPDGSGTNNQTFTSREMRLGFQSGPYYMSGEQAALAVYSSVLTAPMVAAVSAAMAALT